MATSPQDELEQFAARARDARGPANSTQRFFRTATPIVTARAPGRLDVMGGIADYSGSLVLELPAREATFAAVQRAEGGVEVVSRIAGEMEQKHFALSADAWRQLLAADYEEARRTLGERNDDHWAAYVLGVLVVLASEHGLQLAGGLRVAIDSNVPIGKGLSSSAAIEVAVGRAVAELCGDSLGGEELARLCQLAENRVVGAPCGIMDQMTSAVGRAGELLALLCQPVSIEGFAAIPPGIMFWGVDSGIRHAVTGSDYGSVRTGAFMGYRILAARAGMTATPDAECGRVKVADSRWHGYLANVDERECPDLLGHLLERMNGREFLDQYGGITDAVTRIDPARSYAVRAPTLHPIREHARVRRFRQLLGEATSEEARRELGQLMFESHDSYSACGLGSDGTDAIVKLAKAAGPERGVYGAKITGGGSGGTVVVLADADAGPAIGEIARQYSAESGRSSALFYGSSDGAMHIPCVRVG